jgi:hypothetical protein
LDIAAAMHANIPQAKEFIKERKKVCRSACCSIAKTCLTGKLTVPNLTSMFVSSCDINVQVEEEAESEASIDYLSALKRIILDEVDTDGTYGLVNDELVPLPFDTPRVRARICYALTVTALGIGLTSFGASLWVVCSRMQHLWHSCIQLLRLS